MRAPLGPNYRKLWTASAISNVGDGVVEAALPLLAARITPDPAAVGGLAAVLRLPWLLFSLHGGAIVDRSDRRTLMAWADLFRGATFGVLAAAVVGGWVSVPLLYVLAFAVGVGEVLFDNASQAIMPDVVGHDLLERANARLYGVQIVTNQFAGPPIGGLLFAAAAWSPFLLDGGSFVIGALLVFGMRGSFRPVHTERRTMRAEIGEGLRWLFSHRLLRPMALILGAMNLAGNGAFAIMVLFALRILDVGTVGFGILLTAGAVGSLIGTVVASRVSRSLGQGKTLFLSVAVFASTLAVMGATSNPYVWAAAFAVSGLAGIIWNVVTVSLRQSIIPAPLLGRVNSVYRLLAWGTIPIGAAAGGFLARAAGLRAPFYAAAAIHAFLAVAVAMRLSQRAIDDARPQAAGGSST